MLVSLGSVPSIRKGEALMSKLKERSMYEEDEDFPSDPDDPMNPNRSNNFAVLLFFQMSLETS